MIRETSVVKFHSFEGLYELEECIVEKKIDFRPRWWSWDVGKFERVLIPQIRVYEVFRIPVLTKITGVKSLLF